MLAEVGVHAEGIHPFQMALVKKKKTSWQAHSFILQLIGNIVPHLILLSSHQSMVKTLQRTFQCAMFCQEKSHFLMISLSVEGRNKRVKKKY